MDVRRGIISKTGFKAVEYKGPEAAFRNRIQLQRSGTGGIVEFPDFKQFVIIAREEHISMPAVETAFGHMSRRVRRNAAAEEPEAIADAPVHYGKTRRVRIGHYDHGCKSGIVRGQLVLYHARSKLVYFGLFAQAEGKHAGKIQTSEGRFLSLASALRQARRLNIPPQALVQAFGHLMSQEQYTDLMQSVRR